MKLKTAALPLEEDSIDEEELPEGWKWTKLSDTVEIIMGQSPPGDSYNQIGDGIPLINGPVEFGPLPFSETIKSKFTIKPTKMCRTNDLLLCVRGSTTGRINIAGFDACIGRGVAALRSKENQKYLNLFIHSKEKYIYSLGTGSTFPNIQLNKIANLDFPLPPLAEQQRIVARVEALLSHVDAAGYRLSRVPAIMKKFRQAVLAAACSGRLTEEWREDNPDVEPASNLLKNDNSDRKKKKRAGRLWGAGVIPELTEEERDLIPLSWTWTKVKEIGEDPDGTVQVGPMSMQSKTFSEKGVPVLNVGCVQWGYFDEAKLNYMPEDLAQSFNRYKILKNDILFTRSGTVGRCAIATDKQNGYLMTFHLLRVRPSVKKCLPEFLQFVFWGAPNIKRQTEAGVIGSTRAGFNTHLLANLNVPLPPLAEQHEIVRRVGLLFERADAIEREVAPAGRRCERLRQAVMVNIFSGRL